MMTRLRKTQVRHRTLRSTHARCLLATVMLVGGWSRAAGPDVTGVTTQRALTKTTIAIPAVTILGAASASEAAEIGQVVRADLEWSGYFDLLDPVGEGRVPPDRLLDPKAWGAVGAAYLATISLDVAQQNANVRFRFFETETGTLQRDLKFRGRAGEDTRRLGHRIANEIMERIGQVGIFLTRIAYVSRVGRAKEVFMMDYDGQRIRPLTKNGSINLVPSWARDARLLSYVTFTSGKPQFALLDETGTTRHLRPAGGDLNQAPDWSPDGVTLAFTSDRDRNSEIYLYDTVTHRETRLTNHPGIDTAPVWSPSGEELAFTSDRSGSPQIYLMRRDGTNLRRLTYQGQYNESAAWSPDGRKIAFMSRIEGVFQLVVRDLASQQELVITSGAGNKENPRWAPDSQHLVFSSNREGIYSIYTMRDDGTGLTRLTRGTESVTPDWSPLPPR